MLPLACMISPEGPVGAVLDLAREAERIGVRRVWIPDEGLAARESYVTLGAIAVATERIELGVGITNPYTRHPGMTAAAIATLDELSGGRAALGVGAGGGLTLTPLAIDRRRPLTAVRELVDTSRALWSGRVVDHAGVAGSFAGARLPYGRPDIPIWIAGRGPNVLELAGELADGFMFSYVHKELLGEQVATLRAAAAAAGRPGPRISYMTSIATDDAGIEAARTALTFRLVDSPDDVKERIGMRPRDAAAIRAAIADGGPAAAALLVREDWLRHFVIAGSADACRAELGALLADHDIDEFQVSIADPERGAGTLASVAALVA